MATLANSTAIAEKILAERFGGTVKLVAEKDGLGGSDRSNVFRCKISDAPSGAPESVIVKQAVARGDETYDIDSPEWGPAWRLFNDWAGLQFLSDVSDGNSPAPNFYGGDRESGIIVIEDLGNGKRLDHLVLGDDPVEAENGLIELATGTWSHACFDRR